MTPTIEDFENRIIDAVQAFYESHGVSASISSEYNDFPEEFPAVQVRQTGASVYVRTQDESLEPHHFTVTFQIDTFSNKIGTSKSEVKELMKLNNQAMQSMKFTLTSSDVYTNFDRTITRGTQNYRVLVGAPKEVGDDVVYQLYRR